MLNKFRSLYPQGSIQSELITINHGKYIVKVSITVENITLASSLAAAETVETAEDQARNRALALLNLEVDSLSNNNNNILPTISKKSNSVSRNRKKETNILEIPTDSFTPDSSPLLILENQENQDWEIETPNQDEEKTILDIETETQENLTPENSDDFSDLVAKTSLELKRLGWTNEQGRDYLLQTYGKRSRQLLNHQELREFLVYLEKQ